MKIESGDVLMLRTARFAAPLLKGLGDLETRWLGRRLATISIDQPVFVAGLARAGTTILLEEMSKVPGVATHRYRDFPFLMIPYWWSLYVDRFASPREAAERPHRDRIRITPESPEAFEEPLWQYFFPHLHAPDEVHRLTSERRNEAFEAFFRDHLRKILLIRGGRRYLSKGNYNVARIEYLAKLFPDARFIVPIRHPVAHVRSLVRQHELFCRYARDDPRVAQHLAAAGHYEFGPQRVPIRLSHAAGERIRSAWERGDEHAGYAMQWADVYRCVDELRARQDDLARRILVVRYEDFCARPRDVMRDLVRHAEFDRAAFGPDSFAHIAAPDPESAQSLSHEQATIWRETEAVAEEFGYRPP